MKQRTITNEQQLRQASADLLKLGGNLPVVITVTEGSRIRTNSQNAKYWAEVQYFMQEIESMISTAADESGYTSLELKRIVAEDLPIEQAAILFVRKPEAVHDILKGICGIPTSTKLGTKAFMKFENVLSQTMMEIIGNIRKYLN